MAVPHAPEPKMTMRLMLACGSESGFSAGEQAADVLVMLDDDEQQDERPGRRRRRRAERPVTSNQAKIGKLNAATMEETET